MLSLQQLHSCLEFIFDNNHWSTSADHPTLLDGNSLNNYVSVSGDMSNPGTNAARERLLTEGGLLRDGERERLMQWLQSQ